MEINDHLYPEDYLEQARHNLPVVNQVIDSHGSRSIAQYLTHLDRSSPSPYQSRDDLVRIVKETTTELLGEDIAQRAGHDLQRFPIVLTANHLGVDFFAQSIQGSLIYAAGRIGSGAVTTIPVFSFGNVPLNNLTYPRGMLAYRVNHEWVERMPLKLPLFPDRLKRSMVSMTPSFDCGMVDRLRKRVSKLTEANHVSSEVMQKADLLLTQAYNQPVIFNLPDYSRQSTVLNFLIWRRLFGNDVPLIDIIYLEIEKLVNKLLSKDISDHQSLAYQVIFNPSLRQALVAALDGVKGCWSRIALTNRLQSVSSSRPVNSSGSGTVFFWGIDTTGRRVPLSLVNVSGKDRLTGVTDDGCRIDILLEPEEIARALDTNQLLPSLFTCFLTIAFARGMICIGGYHQGEYLSKMKQGVIHALQSSPQLAYLAPSIEPIPADHYLSGMYAIMTPLWESEENGLLPAGPLEIMAGGGLTMSDIDRIDALTVHDAHLAGLFETIPDIIPFSRQMPGWKKRLAVDLYALLKDRLLMK